MTETAPRPVLEARGIVKVFGQHSALDSVDFTAHGGEVHALLGENGAGKSTLIKILTGAYQPDGGELLLDGQPIALRDPLHGQGYGIGTVYQEVNLLPNRSVAENLFLGRQPTRFGLVDRKTIDTQARELLSRYGLDIDVRAELSEYSVAVQQIVAIARAVYFNAKILIMDEPTAALGPHETQMVAELIAELKKQGIGIFLIEHDIHAVMKLCDRAVVMKNGQRVGTVNVNEVTDEDILGMIILGKKPPQAI